MHHGGIGSIGGNGIETFSDVKGLFPTDFAQLTCNIELRNDSLGDIFIEPLIKLNHGYAVFDLTIPNVGDFSWILNCLESRCNISLRNEFGGITKCPQKGYAGFLGCV